METKITIINDYDGYFEWLVSSWLKLETCNRAEIRITAGPYRSYAMSCRVDQDNILHIDFYSALRNGFGELKQQEINEMLKSMFWK